MKKCECSLENPCDLHNGSYDEQLEEQAKLNCDYFYHGTDKAIIGEDFCPKCGQELLPAKSEVVSEPMTAEELMQGLTNIQQEIGMYDCAESHVFLRLKHWNYCNDCGEKL